MDVGASVLICFVLFLQELSMYSVLIARPQYESGLGGYNFFVQARAASRSFKQSSESKIRGPLSLTHVCQPVHRYTGLWARWLAEPMARKQQLIHSMHRSSGNLECGFARRNAPEERAAVRLEEDRTLRFPVQCHPSAQSWSIQGSKKPRLCDLAVQVDCHLCWFLLRTCTLFAFT